MYVCVYACMYVFMYLRMYVSFRTCDYAYVGMSRMSVCLSVCPSVRPSVCLSVSVCLSLSVLYCIVMHGNVMYVGMYVCMMRQGTPKLMTATHFGRHVLPTYLPTYLCC